MTKHKLLQVARQTGMSISDVSRSLVAIARSGIDADEAMAQMVEAQDHSFMREAIAEKARELSETRADGVVVQMPIPAHPQCRCVPVIQSAVRLLDRHGYDAHGDRVDIRYTDEEHATFNTIKVDTSHLVERVDWSVDDDTVQSNRTTIQSKSRRSIMLGGVK